MQITDSNRPICAKCKENLALSRLNELWVCGQCMHEYIQKQIKLRQKMFLEG